MSLPPRPILITGCSSGIGRCVADGLKARGYRVFATARKAADVKTLKADGFESFVLDLADSKSIQSAVAKLFKATGGELYAVFHNGAYGQPGAVEDLSREALREQFETNLFGWVELTRAVLPAMREAGAGRIIFNSSVLGFVSLPFRGAYNASKYALEGIADTLRLELANDIHVSLVEPGPILSRFRENSYAAFKRHIDPHASVHRERYEQMAARLEKEGPAVPFTLPPEAVLKRVIHALESPRPKIRYYVTFPTYLFGYLKRLLPARLLDRMLMRVG